jgi:hypothetical protein
MLKFCGLLTKYRSVEKRKREIEDGPPAWRTICVALERGELHRETPDRSAKLIGHTNADVTLNVYTQAMDDSLRTAVDRVGNELFNIVHSDEG